MTNPIIQFNFAVGTVQAARVTALLGDEPTFAEIRSALAIVQGEDKSRAAAKALVLAFTAYDAGDRTNGAWEELRLAVAALREALKPL